MEIVTLMYIAELLNVFVAIGIPGIVFCLFTYFIGSQIEL